MRRRARGGSRSGMAARASHHGSSASTADATPHDTPATDRAPAAARSDAPASAPAGSAPAQAATGPVKAPAVFNSIDVDADLDARPPRSFGRSVWFLVALGLPFAPFMGVEPLILALCCLFGFYMPGQNILLDGGAYPGTF